MRKWVRKNFKRELLTCFIAISVLPLAFCSLFLIQLFRMKIDRDYQIKDMELAAEVEGRVRELLSSLEALGEEINAKGDITEALRQEAGVSSNAIYRTLYRNTDQLREMAWFELYDKSGVCRYSTGTGTYQRSLPVYWGILRLAARNPGEMALLRPETGVGEGTLLQAARVLLDAEGGSVGFLVMNMGADEFESVLKGIYGGRDRICILDRFLETVYDSGTAGEENIGDVLRDRLLRGISIDADYRNHDVCIAAIEDTGLYTVLIRQSALTADTVNSMYSVLFVMVAALLSLCILLAAGLSSRLSEPIQVLNRTMGRVRQGDLEARAGENWSTEEMAQLSKNFNSMTVNLRDYMERQVEQQKTLNEIQIAMMQAQLNPHFLYNTLDTVKWVAKANHVPEIGILVSKLAKILRASISKEQFTTLREEMQLVESYAEIQRIRFNGRFECVCSYGPDVEDYRLPKLVIQPIVENAVLHGLSECEDGHIRVEAFLEGDGPSARLTVRVWDDGRGVEQEVIDRLKQGGMEEHTGHIGLGNVDKIIRLHYGEEYGVAIDRPKEGGTLVTMTFPADRGEDRPC